MRLISLASGTLPEFDPVTVIESAAAAGFSGCGVWFDPETWTDATTRAVSAAFSSTGLTPLEMEVLVVGDPDRTAHELALLDAGAAVGVTEAVVVSRDPDLQRNIQAFGALNQQAAERGICLCLEYLPIFAIQDLSTALAVLDGVGHENLKLLVDPLHVARTGLDPSILRSVPREHFSFTQFCDAWRTAPHDGSFDALYDEALSGRLLPGEGDLPLTAILDALPDGIPLSVELRARWLRKQFPDPAERARVVFDATAAWLAGPGSPG